jgi:hypothetical protein
MIEIVDVMRVSIMDTDEYRWACQLELSQDSESYSLPATAPGELEEAELQAYFDAREDSLWQLAQEKQYEADVLKSLGKRELLQRLAQVLVDELNILRGLHGLPPRTMAQLKQALKEQ